MLVTALLPLLPGTRCALWYEGGVEEGVCWALAVSGGGGWGPTVVLGGSSSPRLEEKTRSRDGSFSMHSTRDMGRQLKRIWDGWSARQTQNNYLYKILY